ncbi:MAG: hypothetical protein LC795_21975 [Acidobacteria bacterium]|nr:hypothetical protein [Acidobacteriota bacterium]
MTSPKRTLLLCLALLFAHAPAGAQDAGDERAAPRAVTVSLTARGLRFAALGEVTQTRLEV